MQSEIRNRISGDVLSTECELIDVTSIGGHYVPEEDWQHTDDRGHLHFYSDTEDHYPTLKIRRYSYFCHDCHDMHEEFDRVCKECGQVITPGTKPDPKHPAGVTEYMAGPKEYFLNGKPITKEEAERHLQQWREHGEVPNVSLG